MYAIATQIVQSQEQGEEPMEVDPTLYGPSLWDRRQESMSEEISRVAEKSIAGWEMATSRTLLERII